MKKILSLLLVLCMCISMFAACSGEETSDESKPTAKVTIVPTEAPTEEPTEEPTVAPETQKPTEEPTVIFPEDPEVDAVLYRFYNPEDFMWIKDGFISSDDMGIGGTAAGESCYYNYEDGQGMAIEIMLGDPYFVLGGVGDSDTEFNLSEYPVFKIRMKNETLSTTFESFIGGENGIGGPDFFQMEVTAEDEEFKEYIVDLNTIKDATYFEGKDPVSQFRLDCVVVDDELLDECDSNMLYIDYLGFFKTVEEAEAWNPGYLTGTEVETETAE